MNISFTGIKNASYLFFKDSEANFQTKDRILNIQLTDDEYGKDFTEFQKLIKRYGTDIINPLDSDFININTFTINNEFNSVYLNGIKIPECDENLPIFSFIGKITKKISEMNHKDLKVDSDYITSNYAEKALLLDVKLSDFFEQPASECLEHVHSTENVKKGAEIINKKINQIMIDYLG